MNDIIFEIAKQLTFEASFKLKLLIKLLNKRLFGYIKLHKFPYNHTLLNDERIDLFPDLKELKYPIADNILINGIYKSIYPFNESKIEKLKLVSLKLICNDIDEFPYLSNMISLKKLDLMMESSDFKINPFEKLNLKYINFKCFGGYIPDEYIKHMPLEKYNGNFECNYKYFRNTCNSIYLRNNIDELLEFKYIYNLNILIYNYMKLIDFSQLRKLPIHNLTLELPFEICDIATNIMVSILSNLKLHKLYISYNHDGENRIPIQVFINCKLHILKTYCVNKFSDDELKLMHDNDIEVIQTFD